MLCGNMNLEFKAEVIEMDFEICFLFLVAKNTCSIPCNYQTIKVTEKGTRTSKFRKLGSLSTRILDKISNFVP